MTLPPPSVSLVPTDRAARARERERLIEATAEIAREMLERDLDPAPLPAEARDAEGLAASLELAPGVEGLALEAVLERLRAALATTPTSSSWRFVNQLFGGRVAVATAAEALAAIPNISMYTFKAAGAQVLIERELLLRMAERVGLAGAEGCFTPGGSIANLVALLLARNAAAPEARERGLAGAALTVYTSAEGHYSVRKNAGVLGLGRERVRLVPVDARGRMDVEALARRLSEDRARGLRPVLVNATAGTTVRGAFDPLREVAAVAREHGVRMHVDGAFGGSLALSSSRRHLLDGAELADSFSWDPHKMMGVTLQCSVLLVARRGELAASLDESADYLYQADDDDLNPGHRSIQCGRRNDALKLWAAWLRLGDRGWDARLERQLALAARAAELVAADPALRLLEPPMSINVCFEVRRRSSAAICEKLDREGRLKIGHGIVAGRRAIRLVCVNPDLEERDLAAILAEVKAAAAGLPEADDRAAAEES